jgi:hypothetical protein
MDELGVCAHRDDLGIDRLEILMLLCQSGKFCRSDKREISRIEKEHRPFLVCLQGCQADLSEVPFGWFIRLDLEIRYRFPYFDAIVFAHIFSSFSVFLRVTDPMPLPVN